MKRKKAKLSIKTPVEGSVTRLESRKYNYLVDGTLPVLDFEITSGRADKETQHLTVELYNPLSGEVFEAKYPKGRIEVDKDGSITYFSANSDRINFSLFIGHNVLVSVSRTGEVLIKTPSKIVKVEQDIKSSNKKTREVTSDSITLKLE
ncbi:MAG: hypothetical protein JRN15_03620 [Nitrososphaerota archaeon]|nr:hypothetical protein [Nitrososphaerota archaeon]